MKKVYFVRHEESAANANVNAKTDTAASIPLTSNGTANAEAFAKNIPLVADLVITSPFLRTKETAAPYIKLHDIQTVEIWPIQEFTYLHQAKYNGTSTLERRGAADIYWARQDIYYKDGNDCESFNEFIDRVLVTRNKLLTRPEDKIILFSHGYFIQAFIFLNNILLQGRDITESVKKDCLYLITPGAESYVSKVKSSTLHPAELF